MDKIRDMRTSRGISVQVSLRRGSAFALILAVLLICVPSCSLIRSIRGREAREMMGEHVVTYAKTFIGTPYAYGGSGPRSFDCSGFTCYVYSHFGYELHRSATDQGAYDGVRISRMNIRPGDLVFFGTKGRISHVGIVTSLGDDGEFRFIHSGSSTGVTISESSLNYWKKRYIGASRIIR